MQKSKILWRLVVQRDKTSKQRFKILKAVVFTDFYRHPPVVYNISFVFGFQLHNWFSTDPAKTQVRSRKVHQSELTFVEEDISQGQTRKYFPETWIFTEDNVG